MASATWKRLTLRVSPELDSRLTLAARRRRTTKSALVCRALERFLDDELSAHTLLGPVESGVPNLATKHREHVVQSIKRAR